MKTAVGAKVEYVHRGCKPFAASVKRAVYILLCTAVLSSSAFSQVMDLSGFFKPGALRVLILSGRSDHDWRTTTPHLRKLLTDTGRFDVRVCEEPAGLTGETLAPYQVLVVDYGGPRLGKTAEKAIESFVRSGKGMVFVHGAVFGFTNPHLSAGGQAPVGISQPPWLELGKMLGGRWIIQPAKGYHSGHRSFTVRLKDREHPITRGMKEGFIATDMPCRGITLLPGARVLATAFDDPKMSGTGKDEPMLWTNEYGKGRVFCTALGHEVPALIETGFMNTFVRGTEWAASGAVTLLPNTLPAKRPDRLRLLVVTGGHGYETSFYSIFDGCEDILWNHATSNRDAFRNDIRGKFDALVLYDMSQELEDKGKQNLREFVEAGRGIVVLHHAIADYQAWPWWYKEVVGGRYLLKEDGGMPASTYKHDEELFVRPAGTHPITDPIGPIHIRDETYKGMWIRPENQILMVTDNPTSDGPLAWISPYRKSRVVYIELGHDSAAHLHPAYQVLVHRAVLWSAGRLR